MKALRIWLTVVILIVLLAAAALGTALYNNLNSEWQAETAAAEYALNHSPIDHITSHHTFTGDGLQEVFSGNDLFHQEWYAFVQGGTAPDQVNVVSASQVVPETAIQAAAKKSGINPHQITLGYVNPQSSNPALKVSDGAVWEVYGTNNQGKKVYEYFDGRNGKLVWKYML